MFRKAKRLTKRLGINRERCTEIKPSSMSNGKATTENHGEEQTKATQFMASISRTSTRGSAKSNVAFDDDDTINTEESCSSNDDELKAVRGPIFSKCQTAPDKETIYDKLDNSLTQRQSITDTGNLELLLSMETQARMDAQAKREKEKQEQLEQQENLVTPRPTKIKFELPVTPPRSRSPANPRLQYPRARPVRSLPEEGLTANAARHPLPNNNKTKRASWRQIFGDRDEEEALPLPITLDSRVKLRMRYLPTFGYVRFIGGVDFGKGEYIGVELDHGVGNCDGSVDGVRYFDTDHNRGFFCKRHELEAVQE